VDEGGRRWAEGDRDAVNEKRRTKNELCFDPGIRRIRYSFFVLR
jgi:hypothetical protein